MNGNESPRVFENFTVVTANTQFGRAIRDPDGLAPFVNDDVLLLQEVRATDSELKEQLESYTNFKLAHYDEEFGLAIVTNLKHSIKEKHTKTLQDRSSIGRLALMAGDSMDTLAFRMRARGLLAVTLETPEANILTVATTHPTVPVKSQARANQVRRIPKALDGIEGPLVLAGDMNHWPKPRRVDRQMYEAAGLTAVNIREGTFDASQTRMPWLSKLGRFGLQVDGELDAVLYRGEIEPHRYRLVDIPSDHRAVVTTFKLG